MRGAEEGSYLRLINLSIVENYKEEEEV